MPRIKKPKHLFSDELLGKIINRGDEILCLHSLGKYTVGDKLPPLCSRVVLGFVRLHEEDVSHVYVVIAGEGRYGMSGFVVRVYEEDICQE